MSALADLTGSTHGRVQVLQRAGSRSGQALWRCQCSCGSFVTAAEDQLRRGEVSSCGCLRAPVVAVGQVYDRLTVLRQAGYSKNRNLVWRCQCSCGNFVTVQGSSLRSGSTRSCGCLRAFVDHTNKVYGNLFVLGRAANNKHGKSMWDCICSCSAETVASGSDLKKDKVRSCGCVREKVGSKHGA